MSEVVLRLKCRSGTFLMKLPFTCAISDLFQQVSVLSDIPTTSLKLLLGFPPRAIQTFEGSISEAGLKSGDTIIAEADPNASVQCVQLSPKSNVRRHVTEREVGDGPPLILRQVVPADNSCLFTSMGFVLGGKIDLSSGNYMREIIANAVNDDQVQFSEAVLGKSNDDYCDWIRNSNSWGGAIEVSILSSFYGIEVAVIDTQSGSISRFGEDKDYPHRVFLIYDGIHYDPLYLESPFAHRDIQTLFPTNEGRMLEAAQILADEAKSSRQYTDVNRFSLKCLDCGCIMIGQAQAQEHAKLTAHNNFNEF